MNVWFILIEKDRLDIQLIGSYEGFRSTFGGILYGWFFVGDRRQLELQ